jgi:RNA polymerase sigma-70 factor (ECF subfamily)
MDPEQREPNSSSAGQRDFQTTQWSVVLAAGGSESGAAQALESLCATYWLPLYAFARRRGFTPEDAADITQGFFAELLRRQDLRQIDPHKGRFRSFLLAAMKNFIGNQLQAARAQKRGGDAQTLSFDFRTADERLALEPYHEQTPEAVYYRQWALAVLGQARMAVCGWYERSGRRDEFDALQIFVAGDRPKDTYREAAARLNSTEGAVKVAVHRLRQRFHAEIRRQVALTVASESEIDDEVKDLFEALRQ